jgi:hypothetical protein
MCVLALPASCVAVHGDEESSLPGDLQAGALLYQASMTDAESVKGWRMEGPGRVSFTDGWMHMQSPSEEMHHVFWCPKRLPESFVAQWEAQNMETDAGLCIVFFSAAALDDDGSIFRDNLPNRDGTFSQYTKGAIRCYHASYYANAAHNPDRRQTNLRKNPGFHLVQEGEEGIPTKSKAVHTITLAKLGPHIRLWVDDEKVIDWTDTGEMGGEPHGDGFIGFRQMQWTHFRYRNFRVWKAGDIGTDEDRVSDEAIQRRREVLLAKAARTPLNLKAANPKMQNPYILARLAVRKADREHIEYLARGARFHARASWFGMSSLARIVAAHEKQIPGEVLEEIREQVTAYPHFLDAGTENHRAMKRAAGLIFGERWRGDTFHHGISGRELAAICRKFVRDYGRAVYASSMTEYLSPVYHATNTAPWMTVAEYAKDAETRLMARAIVDWMFADLALNCCHNSIVPPLVRCKAQLKGHPGHNRLNLVPTMSTAWLYWGSSLENADAGVESASVPHHARSSYVPHVAIRNIGAKNVALPYALRQSRASHAELEPIAANDFGYEARDEPEFGPATPRYHMRSVYLHDNYAFGAGYFRENIFDSFYRTSIPLGAVWRSNDAYARLVVGHPYWYVNYKPQPWDAPSPEDMWSGVSPFQQVVHHENAAIVLFDIPEIDPYQDVKLRWGPDWAKADPAENPIQSCFAYFPESVDQRVQTDAGFFLREGDVYIAIQPLRGQGHWSDCAVHDYDRIDMPGSVTGCVVEIGDKDEYGSFEAFQDRVAKAELDASALLSDKRVSYVSTRGHELDIRFNHDGWLPHASVNDKPLDFDAWPICESRFVTCRDRVLDSHDGRQGLTIDWRGESPVYTYFDIVDGKRQVTSREYIEADGRLIREKQEH